jgi:hypothetical protein
MKPLHAWSSHAGQTIQWISPDSKENYQQHMSDPAKRSMLQQFGWVDQHIDYTFNSDGFRTHKFDGRDNFVTIGCSFTQGVAVNRENTWAELVSDQLGLSVYNLGISGASADTCYRIIKYYAPVLNPQFVVFLEPRGNRTELHHDPDRPPHLINWAYDAESWGNSTYIKTWLSNDANMQLHAEKNRAAILYVCAELDIPVVMYKPNDYVDLITDKTQIDLGRDLLHPGRLNNRAFAQVVAKDVKKLC